MTHARRCPIFALWLVAMAPVLSACSGESALATKAEDPCASPSAPGDLMQCVDGARYQADLELVAKERPPGSAHWKEVQDLCADRLTSLGYEVERFSFGTSGVDVVGVLPGKTKPDERVFVSAHYDHIPNCPGADDNASGLAGALEVARVLAHHDYDRTLAVACWDQEELGLLGSKAYVKAKAGSGVVASYVFEMIGYKTDEPKTQSVPAGFDAIFPKQAKELHANDDRGDFLAIVPDAKLHDHAASLASFAAKIDLRTTILELSEEQKLSAIFADLRRSDHAPFWEADEGAMMLTDTANFRNANYHCQGGPDTVDRLDNAFATKIIQITAAGVAETLGMR